VSNSIGYSTRVFKGQATIISGVLAAPADARRGGKDGRLIAVGEEPGGRSGWGNLISGWGWSVSNQMKMLPKRIALSNENGTEPAFSFLRNIGT
jgi:hypothetical protein